MPDVERLIHMPKHAYPARRRSKKSFRPLHTVTLAVETISGKHLELRAYKAREDYFVELWQGLQGLRKLHTHNCHRNPAGEHVSGCHMHFPTVTYPLVEGCGSYAYGLNVVEFQSIEQALMVFCDLVVIEIGAMQSLLPQGKRL